MTSNSEPFKSTNRGMVYSSTCERTKCLALPAEIANTDEFIGLSETALECRVKRSQELVKLKLRTPGRLYTHKVKVERADDVIRRLKCEIVEV